MKTDTRQSGLWPLCTTAFLVLLVFAFLFVAVASAFAQNDKECLACHSEKSLSMEKKGKTISLFVDGRSFVLSAHKDLGCIGCHEGFNPAELPHAKNIRPPTCLSCHDTEELKSVGASVHGKKARGGKPAAGCSDCHTVHAVMKVTEKDSLARKAFVEQICAKCHGEISAKYVQSDHGVALAQGIQRAPSCVDCHGVHRVLSSLTDGSPTSRVKRDLLCLKCHQDNPEVRGRVGPSVEFISSYEGSVHARAIRGGNDMAATCSDCHGAHDLKKASNPASQVAKKNIASTCGNCHSEVKEQYEASIHGTAFQKGVMAAPTCTDCHGEHSILSPKDARSPVAAQNVSAQVCSPCHASVRLTQKYGLAGNRLSSFEDSFHGLATKAGSVEVANCGSCHGAHGIKPSTDSTSTIHPANLAKTCGTCHPGANTNFTKGAVHVVASNSEDGLLYFIANSYIVLILAVIGAMLLHNVLDFIMKSKRHLQYRRGVLPRRHTAHRLYVRMTLSERLQHATLLVSFITLVLTGFALRYPDAWWVASIRNLAPWMFTVRGIVHRVAATAMVLASLYHLYYLFFVPRGKELLRDLLPRRQDINDVVNVMRFNLRLTSEKPKFSRFSYVEKAEYWALVWGTVVMSATGVIMWFDNIFLGLLTKLWWDVARTVHYYEAWLATLAIIVWHFYFVIFNPDTYPINLAFWKGTLTEEEMEEEHPLELEAIKAKQLAAEEARAVAKEKPA